MVEVLSTISATVIMISLLTRNQSLQRFHSEKNLLQGTFLESLSPDREPRNSLRELSLRGARSALRKEESSSDEEPEAENSDR